MTHPTIPRIGALLSLLFAGAIFGFFYAYAASAMWGLDAVDPRVAIEAMQGINAQVRNAAFFPSFFLTPLVLAGAALAAHRSGARPASLWFLAGAVIYLAGGLVLTMAVNVPMNEALALVTIPGDRTAAQAIWDAYSGHWQVWNWARTVFSGVALACAGQGALTLPR